MSNIDKQALREAAEKYRATYAAHLKNPRDYDAVDAWDKATSEFMALVNNDELNIIADLLDKMETEEGQRKGAFLACNRWHDKFREKEAKLEAAEKRIEAETDRANREHHRGFMMACKHLEEHANVHYADAAEMEIAALRQRIAELEARTVKFPQTIWYDCDGESQEIAVLEKRLVEKALCEAGVKFAAGIGKGA
ncbi:TPA: ead/Ea22-like family protein [Citrobacter koseri]|nr:ead/Ea22-like family protein [Citrobacter koseri]